MTVGDVSSTEALVWTRADAPGDVTLEVSSQSHFPAGAVTTYAGTARRASDNTITIRVSGLTPGSRYFYRFRRPGGTSVVGQFETAPKPSQTRTITFAYSGDADAQPAKGQTKPFFNHFQAYAQMAREGNDFNINLGDTIYSDSLVQSTAPHGVLHLAFPPALSRKAKWAKYRMNLGLFNLRRVRRSAAMYDQWDDHEFVNDFTPAEMGQKLYRAGRDAFRDYMPAPYSKEDGIYRTVRWGKNVQLFFPDERSFRSAKASAHHVCDNPQTHQPDVAPTLPPSKRALFSVLVPQL